MSTTSWVLIYFFSFLPDICMAVRMGHKSKNNPDRFCYICGNVVLSNRQAKITGFVKKAYHNYFGVKIGDKDKPFAPSVCCKIYVENLWDWRNGKMKSMPFAIPMNWREGKDIITDCYFCMINLKGINRKNKHDVLSAIKPIPHSPDLSVSEPDRI